MNMRGFFPIVVILLIAGCSLTLGDSYKPIEPSYNRAVVYIYSDDSMSTGQVVHVDSNLASPDAQISVSMISGGYFPLTLAPGEVRFFTGDDKTGGCVQGVVQGGQQYFIKVSDTEFENVEWIASSKGQYEIASHRRITSELRGKSDATFSSNCVNAQF